MVQLQQWLASSRPFADGVALLRAHGKPGKVLLDLLDLGETSYSRRRLEEAILERFKGMASDAPKAHVVMDSPNAGIDHCTHPDREQPGRRELTPELREVKTRQWQLREEQVHLKASLEKLPTREERHRVAVRIMVIERERLRNWNRLDHFVETGHDLEGRAPVEPGVVKVITSALERRKRTVMTYISRSRSRPEMLARYKAELAEIEQQLKC